MSQYSPESMPDAKIESGSFFSFGDMMSQDFLLKKGTCHKIQIFTHGNGFYFEKSESLCPDLFLSNQS